MNDDKEIKYVYELMKKELKLLEAPNDIILKLEELNTILPDDVYVWSFSENDYSQALSNYGDIALGFDSQGIMEQLASYYSKGKKTLDEYTVGKCRFNTVKVKIRILSTSQKFKRFELCGKVLLELSIW